MSFKQSPGQHPSDALLDGRGPRHPVDEVADSSGCTDRRSGPDSEHEQSFGAVNRLLAALAQLHDLRLHPIAGLGYLLLDLT